MLRVDLFTVILLAFTFCSSAVVLGITAYEIHEDNQLVPFYQMHPDGSSTFVRYIHIAVPWEDSLVLAASAWSIVVTSTLLTTAFVKRSMLSPKLVGFGTLALTTITLALWIAAFASYVFMYGGNLTWAVGSAWSAYILFFILTWIAWLALWVANILTALGIVRSELNGRNAMFQWLGPKALQADLQDEPAAGESPAGHDQEA